MARHLMVVGLGLVVVILGGSLMYKPVLSANDTPLEATSSQPDAEFALDLYGKIRTTPGNLAYSPFSISTALGMTMAGARGTTADAMGKVLHRPADDPATQKTFGQLVAAINGEGKRGHVKLVTANALFGQEGEPFVPDYLKLVTSTYEAEIRSLNFGQADAARTTINTWVESKTADKIKNLLGPGTITPATSLVLVNAVYFKGDWEHEFRKQATAPLPFYTDSGKPIEVPTMRQTETFGYAAFDGLQVLKLPYKGGRQSMTVILPKKGEELAKLEASLTVKTLDAWRGKLTPEHVAVSLPRFKATSQFSLAQPLRDLGMSVAFSGSADFSGIRPSGGLSLSDVIHQAFVQVDEQGTEAAAATAVIGVRSAAFVKPPVEFKADHPFLFVITDDRTGALLFAGRVVDPK